VICDAQFCSIIVSSSEIHSIWTFNSIMNFTLLRVKSRRDTQPLISHQQTCLIFDLSLRDQICCQLPLVWELSSWRARLKHNLKFFLIWKDIFYTPTVPKNISHFEKKFVPNYKSLYITDEIFNAIFNNIIPLTIFYSLSSLSSSIYLFHTINERQFCKLTHNLSFPCNINYIS
jgi:hypothetical protein